MYIIDTVARQKGQGKLTLAPLYINMTYYRKLHRRQIMYFYASVLVPVTGFLQ